ncbi:hypothetical protein PHYPSEUDO_000362 [Phytophthora pseudosyringae]|uniref:Uncharacterized protein n=1 Tax=Phytophthora pseudosyringae TaxID=221518 RepID=A0A8T1VY77_9STRA|nr:hypothetical protein PHYPSEUDO_000362 [Phytophthora pseudosyringae]
MNDVTYRVGFSYRFEKVRSLRLLYGNPFGCVQIRRHLHPMPLPAPGFVNVAPPAQPLHPTDSARPDNSTNLLSPPALDTSARIVQSSDAATTTRDSPHSTKAITTAPSKRKARKTNINGETLFKSPTKKTRSAMGA